jgi:hypothetical protein
MSWKAFFLDAAFEQRVACKQLHRIDEAAQFVAATGVL